MSESFLQELISIAADLATPTKDLENLANNNEPLVRRAVAGNPSTPTETLEILVQDLEASVRTAVIENPRTPDFLLDEKNFDLLETLVDAESRGSSLARQLRDTFVNFDETQAFKRHKEVESLLNKMKEQLIDLLEDFEGEDLFDAFDEIHYHTLPPTTELLFDWDLPTARSASTFQLIFDELSKSMEDFGSFGNSELLEDYVGWTNAINNNGYFLSPFIPRNVLRSMIGWNASSNSYMSSIAVSPILSTRLLHYVADSIIPMWGSEWIGLALIVNANSDLYVLDSICKYGIYDISISYCQTPSAGGMDIEEIGVCGPLVGKSWFATSEVFEDWSEDDLVGPLSEGAPKSLRNLVKVADLYLGTSQGAMESSRDNLASSEYFGKILVCFRMIEEFKFGRSKVNEEMNSESPLVRTALYWMPGLDSESRSKLEGKGILFPDEVGQLLIKGWTEDLSLIF